MCDAAGLPDDEGGPSEARCALGRCCVCAGDPRCIVLCRSCVFHNFKVCSTPVSSKSIGAIFPDSFRSLHISGHILVILAISETFSLLFFVVLCDQ